MHALLLDTFERTWRAQLTPAAIQAYFRDRIAERYVEDHSGEFLVAEMHGRVIGMVHQRAGFIEALHVLGACERRGLGRALMAAAEAQMRDRGVRRASLETDTFNLASQRFYEALGYREAARYPDTEWNSGLTTIRYEKDLGDENGIGALAADQPSPTTSTPLPGT